jgi:hypothetical protein
MSEYDDDDSDDYGIAQGKQNKPVSSHDAVYKLTIDGLPHEAIMDAVYRRIAQETYAKLTQEQQSLIKATIQKSVDEAVVRIVETRLEAEVNKLIDQGWDEHDTWGQRTGKKFTLAERITTYLQQNVDQYESSDYRSSGDKKQRVQWYVTKAVESIFTRETNNLIEDFKKQVRASFDKSVADQVAKSIKAAMGLS